MSKSPTEERTEIASGGEMPVSRRSSSLGYADRGLSALERWLNYAGVFFLISLMVMVVAEVVSRYLFNRPITGYIDIMEMMMVVLVFLTLAYCQREGGHIRMELFMTRVLKGGRSYNATELLHLLISLVGFAMIAYFSIKEALHAYATGDTTMLLFWPTWPARILVALGSTFLCIRFVVQFFHFLNQAVVGVRRTKL